ncbi:MAG TPA: hypothetical protein VNW04_18960, partial [Puia sp.]|nr:hypothetical protein [Puia sp.]
MRIITVTLIGLIIFSSLQTCAQPGVRDSVDVYQSKINRLYRQTWDSLRKSDSVVYYSRRLREASKRSKAYGAFALFTTIGNADFNSLNRAIAKDGFGPIAGPIWGVGAGFSSKGYNGVMFDFAFATIGIDRKV